MSDEEFIVTTADMLEIVAGGGNGVEYVNIPALIEKAAKELREKDETIARLREALKPFADDADCKFATYSNHYLRDAAAAIRDGGKDE